MAVAEKDIENLIYGACLRMNAGDYAGWLDELCLPSFRYSISAYSEELGQRMTWFDHERQPLLEMCLSVGDHFTNLGRFHRHASVYRVGVDSEAKEAETLSSVIVMHTTLEGESRFYATGYYEDRIDISGACPLFKRRNVALTTTLLPSGSHLPL